MLKPQKERIKLAFRILREISGRNEKINMKEIMIKAGFSESYSKHPGILVKSKLWRKLEEQYDRKHNPWKFREPGG